MDYKNAGVDIEAGYESVKLMKKFVQKTMRPEVLTNIGGFSGAFALDKFKDMEEPTLVSGTDGENTIPSVLTVWLCASTISHVPAANHYFSWITLPAAKTSLKRLQPLSAVLQKAAYSRKQL